MRVDQIEGIFSIECYYVMGGDALGCMYIISGDGVVESGYIIRNNSGGVIVWSYLM